MSALTSLFKKPDPRAQLRSSQREIGRNVRDIEREILALQREEAKCVREVKAAAAQGNMKGVKILAQQVVRIRNQKAKLHSQVANLRGVTYSMAVRVGRCAAVHLGVEVAGVVCCLCGRAYPHGRAFVFYSCESIVQMRTLFNFSQLLFSPQTAATTGTVAQSLGSASKAMAAVNSASDLKTAQKAAQEFARQSYAMEVADDIMDSALDTDEVEDEADDVVNQVLDEIGVDVGAALVPAGRGTVPARAQRVAPTREDQELEAQIAALTARR